MTKMKRTNQTKYFQLVKTNWNSPTFLAEMQNWHNHFGKQFLKELSRYLPEGPSHLTSKDHKSKFLNICPKNPILFKLSCISMYIATLFVTAPNLKQSKCKLISERIKKLWYIHIMEYCSVVKRHELFIQYNMDKTQNNYIEYTYSIIPFL